MNVRKHGVPPRQGGGEQKAEVPACCLPVERVPSPHKSCSAGDGTEKSRPQLFTVPRECRCVNLPQLVHGWLPR